jgi:hypothetical protein
MSQKTKTKTRTTKEKNKQQEHTKKNKRKKTGQKTNDKESSWLLIEKIIFLTFSHCHKCWS